MVKQEPVIPGVIRLQGQNWNKGKLCVYVVPTRVCVCLCVLMEGGNDILNKGKTGEHISEKVNGKYCQWFFSFRNQRICNTY